jgi:hypothetical protein
VSARFARLVALIAAVQIMGGHWLALQSVAWIGMIASYSRGETLATAVEKTFDGEHPCTLCKVVKSGRDEEQKRSDNNFVVKLDAVLVAVKKIAAPVCSEWGYPAQTVILFTRSLAPPTPPPLVV